MLKGEVLLELSDKDRQRKADYQLKNSKERKSHRSALFGAVESQEFPKKMIDKQCIVNGVAFPQPPWLHDQPEEPLKPCVHHPQRGACRTSPDKKSNAAPSYTSSSEP